MAKFETFAMAFGLIISGILTFAALPLALSVSLCGVADSVCRYSDCELSPPRPPVKRKLLARTLLITGLNWAERGPAGGRFE